MTIPTQVYSTLRAMAETDPRDENPAMKCNGCGWQGFFFSMYPAVRYPGMPRCPECKSEDTASA